MTEHYFPEMKRVELPGSTHIEPELDSSWDELTKLRWNAAAQRVDSGAILTVEPYSVTENTTWFTVRYANTTHSPLPYGPTWTKLNDLGSGYKLCIDTMKKNVLEGVVHE